MEGVRHWLTAAPYTQHTSPSTAPRFDVSFVVEVYDKKDNLIATLRPALSSTGGRKTIVTAPVSASPCYLHVNPRLASTITLDLECEEEVLGATANRAKDLVRGTREEGGGSGINDGGVGTRH